MADRSLGSVVIAGAGVIGSGIAFELAQRGVSVTLVERGRIGGEASWASAGIVSLPSRPWMKPSGWSLGRISLERYPALVAELEERTGLAIDYRRPGEWVIAVDEEHAEAEQVVAAWQRGLGLDVEDVPPAVARTTEPALPESLLAAWFHPNVGSLSVYRLTQALANAARQLGATVLEETPVGGLLREATGSPGCDCRTATFARIRLYWRPVPGRGCSAIRSA